MGGWVKWFISGWRIVYRHEGGVGSHIAAQMQGLKWVDNSGSHLGKMRFAGSSTIGSNLNSYTVDG